MVSVVVRLVLGLALVAAAGSKLAGGAWRGCAGHRRQERSRGVGGVGRAHRRRGRDRRRGRRWVDRGGDGRCAADGGPLRGSGASDLGGTHWAPCACFGAKGTVGTASAGRAAALAAALALVPLLPREEPTTQGWLAIGLAFALLGLGGPARGGARARA